MCRGSARIKPKSEQNNIDIDTLHKQFWLKLEYIYKMEDLNAVSQSSIFMTRALEITERVNLSKLCHEHISPLLDMLH